MVEPYREVTAGYNPTLAGCRGFRAQARVGLRHQHVIIRTRATHSEALIVRGTGSDDNAPASPAPSRSRSSELPAPETAVLDGYAPCAPIQKRHTKPIYIEKREWWVTTPGRRGQTLEISSTEAPRIGSFLHKHTHSPSEEGLKQCGCTQISLCTQHEHSLSEEGLDQCG